jgi:hypothetical protein
MRELNKMNLHDHRLAAILQIRTVFAARMLELRELRRRVQIAQLSPRRRRRVRSRPRFLDRLMPSQLAGQTPPALGRAPWPIPPLAPPVK